MDPAAIFYIIEDGSRVDKYMVPKTIEQSVFNPIHTLYLLKQPYDALLWDFKNEVGNS